MNTPSPPSKQVPGVLGVVRVLHGKTVFGRRVRVLARHLAGLIPAGSHVLDVGCGDGAIDHLISQNVPGVYVEGIDVLVRPTSHIAVRPFDGLTIPCPQDSFDVVMFVDVLHHTRDPLALLREAARVAKTILIKDHTQEGILAGPTLRFMDWVGNAPHRVVLPYNYWTRAQWNEALRAVGLMATRTEIQLGLYPAPASWLFDRKLHFVAKWERIRDAGIHASPAYSISDL
ncbi:MAG: class I SAM-dependent methyltransferase [Candidatus Acidiferrales bacterium]